MSSLKYSCTSIGEIHCPTRMKIHSLIMGPLCSYNGMSGFWEELEIFLAAFNMITLSLTHLKVVNPSIPIIRWQYICGFLLLSSCSVMSSSLQPHGLQNARLPCPSPSPRACSNPCLLSQWCHPTVLSSIVPFFSCLQSFPASGSFQMNQLFASGGRSIGASASALPVNIQGWFPLFEFLF